MPLSRHGWSCKWTATMHCALLLCLALGAALLLTEGGQHHSDLMAVVETSVARHVRTQPRGPSPRMPFVTPPRHNHRQRPSMPRAMDGPGGAKQRPAMTEQLMMMAQLQVPVAFGGGWTGMLWGGGGAPPLVTPIPLCATTRTQSAVQRDLALKPLTKKRAPPAQAPGG